MQIDVGRWMLDVRWLLFLLSLKGFVCTMRCFLAFMVLLAVISPATAQDMPLTMVLLPGEKWQPVSGELRRIRSLASGANGDVFAAANDGETILRIDRDGRAHDFARPSSAVMGLAFAPDGRLYA